MKGEMNIMKKYETPEIMVNSLETEDVIASTFTEGSDNETGWLDKWTSGIIGEN